MKTPDTMNAYSDGYNDASAEARATIRRLRRELREARKVCAAAVELSQMSEGVDALTMAVRLGRLARVAEAALSRPKPRRNPAKRTNLSLRTEVNTAERRKP